MLTTKERPPLARAALPAVRDAKREQPESSAAQRRLQHLKAARQLGDEARLRLHLMEEHLHAAGVAVDDAAFLDDVKEIVRDLNCLILAGGDVAQLRPEWPVHASRAAVAYRQERDRRARR